MGGLKRVVFFCILTVLPGGLIWASPDEGIAAINLVFRKAYEVSEKSKLERKKAILVATNDRLTLYSRDSEAPESHETQRTLVPEMRLYHDLKTISHVPAALHLLCEDSKNHPIPGKLHDDLLSFKGLLIDGKLILKKRGYAKDIEGGSLHILDSSIQFINRVIEKGRIPSDGANELACQKVEYYIIGLVF